jgi:hypothetical protein
LTAFGQVVQMQVHRGRDEEAPAGVCGACLPDREDDAVRIQVDGGALDRCETSTGHHGEVVDGRSGHVCCPSLSWITVVA